MSDNKIQDQPTTESDKINDLVTAFNTKVESLNFTSKENDEVLEKLKESAKTIQVAAQANIPSRNTSILSLELLDNLRMSLIDINNNKDYSQAERNSYRKGILDAIAIANDANNIPKEPSSFQRKQLEKLWKEAQANAENDYIQARKQKATDRAPLKWKDSKNVIALIVASAIVAAILFNPYALAAIGIIGAVVLLSLAVIAVAIWLTKGQGVNRMINSKNWFSSEVLGGKGGMEHTKQEYMDKKIGKKDDYISSQTNEKNMKDEKENIGKLKATHDYSKNDLGVKSVAKAEAVAASKSPNGNQNKKNNKNKQPTEDNKPPIVPSSIKQKDHNNNNNNNKNSSNVSVSSSNSSAQSSNPTAVNNQNNLTKKNKNYDSKNSQKTTSSSLQSIDRYKRKPATQGVSEYSPQDARRYLESPPKNNRIKKELPGQNANTHVPSAFKKK